MIGLNPPASVLCGGPTVGGRWQGVGCGEENYDNFKAMW